MQAVKYKWLVSREQAEPFIVVRTEQGFDKIKLLEQAVSLKLGRKTCVGYYRDGRHFECPKSMPVESAWHCNECRLNDDYFLCIQCTGNECLNTKQREDCSEQIYYIYLAAFSNILKVGISIERRITERLVEQGADLGALIALVKDGKEVRLIEQQICKKLNIVDRIRGFQKHELIFGDPNAAAINILNAVKKLKGNGFDKYTIKPEIHDLRPYYRLHNVVGNPQRVDVTDNLTINGNIVAAKGNIIIFENQGNFYSLNSHELIGRELVCEVYASV